MVGPLSSRRLPAEPKTRTSMSMSPIRRRGAKRANPDSPRLTVTIDLAIKQEAVAQAQEKALSLPAYVEQALRFYQTWRRVLDERIVEQAMAIGQATGRSAEDVIWSTLSTTFEAAIGEHRTRPRMPARPLESRSRLSGRPRPSR